MALTAENGAIAPWLDNYPIYRQLWDGPPSPGNELKLSSPVGRGLTLTLKTPNGQVGLISSELQADPYIAIADSDRGVVVVQLRGAAWAALREDITYTAEITAYGALYDSFLINGGLPEPFSENLSGAEVYASPREVLELIGNLPGANVSTAVDLTGGWSLNAERYWVRTISKAEDLHGLWVNDYHVRQVSYPDLALAGDRAFARVAGVGDDTIYLKQAPTDPALVDSGYPVYIETALNRRTFRNLQEATAEAERLCGRMFMRRRYYREGYRGLSQAFQVFLRHTPIAVDEFFRLDCYSRTRRLLRRYTELNLNKGDVPLSVSASSSSLHLDSQTGIVNVTQGLLDYSNWDGDTAFTGASYFPAGNTAIEASYTGGYDRIPADLSDAVTMLAAMKQLVFWQMAMSQGAQSINIGCVSMNFSSALQYSDPWKQEVERILNGYQVVHIEAF